MYLNGVGSVPLGNSMFLAWEDIDVALNQWAKSYFGDHVEAQGGRDENSFEIEFTGFLYSDFEKYRKLFEMYDKEKDYDPEEEFELGEFTSTLPAGLARGLMDEVLVGHGLVSFGTALATYDGVFFMENDRFGRDMNGKLVEQTTKTAAIPEVDEVVVRMAYMAGELEARKEIVPMEWDDLCAAINDAVKEYYDNPSETNPFQVEDVADKVLRARFRAKALEDVLDEAKERGNKGTTLGFDFELEP